MGKLIKTALVFIGGMAAGGCCVVHAAFKSETFVTALKETMVKKISNTIFGAENDRAQRTTRYRSYYDVYREQKNASRPLAPYNDVIIFDSCDSAEGVLCAMAEIIDLYGMVSFADMYDLVGIDPVPYSANKYGWRSLDGGKVVRCRNGYTIDLPPEEEIR